MTNKTKFRPVVGTSEQIESLEAYSPGALYFATDSGKIYLALETTSKILVGGSGSSIFYASDTNVKLSEDIEDIYILDAYALDDYNSFFGLKENDLIINSDNCFYKISEIDIDENKIYASKLVVAGTGGGSGSGGGGSAAQGACSVKYVSSERPTVRYGDDCNIVFNVIATDSAGEPTSGGRVVWYVGTKLVAEQVVSVGENTFNVGPYLENTNSIQQVRGVFSLDTGGDSTASVNKRWQVTAVSVNLIWDYDFSQINKGNNFLLNWTVSGGGSIEKTTHIEIVETGEKIDIKSTSNSLQSLNINRREHGLTHGVYTFKLKATFSVNGEVFPTKEIVKEIMFVDEDNSAPLISIGDCNTTMFQYDTLLIPVYIYQSDSAILSIDGVKIEEWKNLRPTEDVNVLKYWSYTPVVDGQKILVITCGTVEKTILVTVEPVNIGSKEPEGYAFKLKANEFSSNEALRAWNSNGVNLSFSDNFDWVNGGLQQEIDENNGGLKQLIKVKAGTTMTINYDLFKTFNTNNGKSIKIIFKVNNCSDYDTTAISCMSGGIGLDIQAQAAIFKSDAPVSVPYCEDTYLEYSLDFNVKDKRYIMPWIDGVPVGIKIYDPGTSFTQINSVPITVGSEDCDVCIYLVKVYETHLTDEQHLSNFILDASNSTEMLARYKRNDILSDEKVNEIDWKKLVKNNPTCQVHLYDIPYMTYTKKTKVPGAEYHLYKNGNADTPVLSAGTNYNKKYEIKVQGTSSAAYGLAAFNIDTDFKEGFLLGDIANGEEASKYSLYEGAIPEKYFNTKVNVASCEQGNNAINADWYNTYQPYMCAARKKDENKRDTMKFEPGIMFVLDRNEVVDNADDHTQQNIFAIDTPGYLSNPYYKMYSVCNFGNSKKNIATLHDAENENEITIEVTDNQEKGQWMVKVPGATTIDKDTAEEIDLTNEEISFDESTGTGNLVYNQFVNSLTDIYFDIRYANGSDGIDSASPKQIIAFFNLLKWFASNDPCAYDEDEHPHGYTGEAIDPVTFPAYTFKKTNWLGDDTVLGGLTINKFAGTYDHDTHEYRMAKLLSECEDHLIMDSIVYHYLFIERHTMVDNVAKNTFWSTEDENCQYWNLVKNYDNDTADGNDNSGNLTLTYGIEGQDKTSATTYAFNAHQAVWFNFIGDAGMEQARRKMYQALDLKGAWSATPYLARFDTLQSSIPERCWIEDYYRKYIRPTERFASGGTKFLAMLEGGKKTAQRKQYETYQEIYLGTKYQASNIINTSNVIDIRGNSKESLKENAIPVVMYNDCYIVQGWGSGAAINLTQRVKRGEVVNIIPPLNNMNDATIYWYVPRSYSSIGDISLIAPKNFALNNTAKLKEFILGESANEESLDALESINFTGNVLLKKLVAKNCHNLGVNGSGQSLDLSDLVSLKELDITGSNITMITLPNGAPLQKIKLSAVTGIIASNLREIQSFEIENYSKVRNLILDNIDNTSAINSLDILKGCTNLERYYLQNVNWTIDSASDISGISIPILDWLNDSNKKPSADGNNESSKADALTGTLTITASAYSGDKSFEIYDKYNKIFPGLNIVFESPNSSLYEVVVVDGNGAEKWKRKYRNEITLTKDFFSGLENVLDSITVKSKTMSKVYTFKNQWLVEPLGTVISAVDGFPVDSAHKYSSDIVISPIFDEQVRQYDVKFANEDGTETYYLTKVDYGTVFNQIENPIQPYKPDDPNFNLEEIWVHKGWTLMPGGSLIDEEHMQITRGGSSEGDPLVFYAKFEVGSVYDNILEEKYLDFTKRNSSTYSTLINGCKNNNQYIVSIEENSYSVAVKPGVILRGKITLPAFYKGLPVSSVGYNCFQNQTRITHVFFEKDNQYQMFANRSFAGCTNLKYIEPPTNLKVFAATSMVNLSGVLFDVSSLKHLEAIDYGAFANSVGQEKTYTIYTLPNSLKFIGDISFSNTGKRTIIQTLQIGEPGTPESEKMLLENFGTQAFSEANTNMGIKIINIEVYAQKTPLMEDFVNSIVSENPAVWVQ